MGKKILKRGNGIGSNRPKILVNEDKNRHGNRIARMLTMRRQKKRKKYLRSGYG